MPLASFVKRNPGRLSHICAKKHLIVEISVRSSWVLKRWTAFTRAALAARTLVGWFSMVRILGREYFVTYRLPRAKRQFSPIRC
jgi:hypothetical protein